MKRFLTGCMCLLAFVLVAATLLVKPVQAQDAGETAEGQVVPANTLPTGWTVVSEDEYTKWRLDVNSACIFTDHSYTLNLPEDPARMSDIRLTMSNFDVDYFDPQECEGGPEFDNADLNGQPLGILAGANDSWSLNSWTLDRNRLVKGDNRIFIDTDATGTGCWCVAVGSIELQAKVGFQVVNVTPADDDRNRDFHADKLDLTVTFSNDLDAASVNDQTFQLFYRDAADRRQEVEGSFTLLAPNKFRFTPNADLLPGVRYYAWVQAGATGIKNSKDVPLDDEKLWIFWTVPDLNATSTFDYGQGSRCPPSTSPCKGLEIAVFQVARNATMVPNKDAVARLYLRWQKQSGVSASDQITEMDVNVALSVTPGGGNYSARQTVKRPDRYTRDELFLAENTINVYHNPGSGSHYGVQITPVPQTNAAPVVFTANLALPSAGKSPTITFRHYFLKDGEWSGGVPAAIKTQALNNLIDGKKLTLDMFPIVEVNPINEGDFSIGYTYTGATVTDASCGVVKEVRCPLIPGVSIKRSEPDCIFDEMESMRGGNPVVAVTVPQSACPKDAGLQSGHTVLLMGATAPIVLPHELGHAYGISPANNPNPGHRSSPEGIEGFQIRGRNNHSRVESPEATFSLMQAEALSGIEGRYWIHNDDYAALFNTVTVVQATSIASVDAGPYLFVSGLVDIVAGSAQLAPLILQETPNEPDAPGACTADLLDGANTVLGSASFTPGLEIYSSLAHDATEMATNTVQSPTADGLQPFAVTLAWNESAKSIKISCNGSPLLTLVRSTAIPTADFTALADGVTLSNQAEIMWTGSDANGDALSYQLLFSDDNGATWSPLTIVGEATSYRLDTQILPSGSNRILRLKVTDGFNTAFAERTFTIANSLAVMGAIPPDSAENVPLYTPVEVTFNTPIDPASLSTANFSVEDDRGPITGSVTMSPDGRTVSFQPKAPFKADSSYAVHVDETLRDISGATLLIDQEWSFQTISDTVPPLVEHVSPADGELNVPLNALVDVQFSEELLAATPATSFSLVNSQNQPVAGLTTYDPVNGRLVFVPDENLQPNTVYTATVTTDVLDLNNNALEQAQVWSFTTGDHEGPLARIIGNYSERLEDIDHDGLYDLLTIYVDVQAFRGFYNLNARLVDQSGELIQWTHAEFGPALLSGYLEDGVYRLALTFDAATIRAHQQDGPYFLDSLYFYGEFFNSPEYSEDYRFNIYQTLPYDVTKFAGVLSLRPLPDRLLEWSTSHDNAWNLRDYTVSLDTPLNEVTYQIIGNSDPRVGVSIDSDHFVDIHPTPGIELESTVTVEAHDKAGNHVQGSFLVRVEKPTATQLVVVPAMLQLGVNQETQIEVEIQDQFRHPFRGEDVELAISNELPSATVTPATVTTSTGHAVFNYAAGEVSGTDIVSINAGGGVSAELSVVIAENKLLLPSLQRAP